MLNVLAALVLTFAQSPEPLHYDTDWHEPTYNSTPNTASPNQGPPWTYANWPYLVPRAPVGTTRVKFCGTMEMQMTTRLRNLKPYPQMVSFSMSVSFNQAFNSIPTGGFFGVADGVGATILLQPFEHCDIFLSRTIEQGNVNTICATETADMN